MELRDYGAMVEMEGHGGTRCLLHVSQMAAEHTPAGGRPAPSPLRVGQEVRVRCLGRDPLGNPLISNRDPAQPDTPPRREGGAQRGRDASGPRGEDAGGRGGPDGGPRTSRPQSKRPRSSAHKKA